MHRQFMSPLSEGSKIEFSTCTAVGYVFMKLNTSKNVNYKTAKHVARKQWRN
jgi:hypothetical protein